MPQITLPSGRTVDLDANPTGSTTGIPSNILANHPAGYDPAYGGAPDIPAPLASAWQALGGNMDLLPALFSFGNAYNAFNYDQRLGQVQGTPGFAGVASNLAGQLPQDVVNQLAQHSAERGISTGGAPDSPNLNAAYLRSLGLNSLDLQNRGQGQLNSLLGQFQQAAPYNLMSGLVSSEDQQAANAAANVSAAAPNPRAAADEEQRRLLEAIEAGKRAAGGAGPVGSGGIDVQKIIDAFNAAHRAQDPQVTVGHGPAQTVNRGTGTGATTTTPFRSNYVDPGASGLIQPERGRPNDVIKNAFMNPDLADAGVLGGQGTNPLLNSILGQGGLWGHLTSSNFGNYTGGSNQSAGPWNPATGMVTSGHTAYPGITAEDISRFGQQITAPPLQYGDTSAGLFGGSQSGINLADYSFGQPITTRNMMTGNPMASTEELMMMFGLIPETSGITPNDISQFGNPITVGGLMGGIDTGSIPAIDDVDFYMQMMGGE